DRAVQIFGGNGFVHGNPAERAYRDARVNRIFEGTNEINRLLLSGLVLRKAEKGQFPLPQAIEAVQRELLAPAREMTASERLRKTGLLLAGLAWQRHGAGLIEHQELLAGLSDLMIATYLLQAAESRAADGLATRIFAAETLARMEVAVVPALASIAEGDTLRTQLLWLRRLLKHEVADTWQMRRQLAQDLLA
ncbi:MAG: acyl-CoA dehydrogenase family protein, partial [Terriglobales bacterium]